MFHLAEVSMQRSFDLARRDVPGSNQKVLGALQEFMKLLSGWHLQVTDDLPLDHAGATRKHALNRSEYLLRLVSGVRR